jgi:hypothetical protein
LSKLSKRILVISLAANLLLAGGIIWLQQRSSARVMSLCSNVAGDLDFLIDGLENGRDPLYSPLIVRPLERILTFCMPKHQDGVQERAKYLRVALGHIRADTSSLEQKEAARRDALRILRELRPRN